MIFFVDVFVSQSGWQLVGLVIRLAMGRKICYPMLMFCLVMRLI